VRIRGKNLDFLFRKLHFQSQRVGEAVREIGETGQQMDVDDFRFRELLAQESEIAVSDFVRGARQLFDLAESGPFFFAVARIIPRLQRRPILRGQPDALRGGHVVLDAVVASIDQRDAQVDQFI
jgi:hypothetical protein